MQRQVPKYCIIGDGNVARHLSHYMNMLGVSFRQWSRRLMQKKSCPSLEDSVADIDVVLLLISDDTINQFYLSHTILKNHDCVHFSGTLHLHNIVGCHPLMTFSNQLYSLKTYQSIPFIIETGEEFGRLFPAFTNPIHYIEPEKKTLYHSLCVMAGNFPQILWQAVNSELDTKCDLPPEILKPYLNKVLQNFLDAPDKSLTGPLQRGDKKTIEKHQNVLNQTELSEIYQAFVNYFKTQNRDTL